MASFFHFQSINYFSLSFILWRDKAKLSRSVEGTQNNVSKYHQEKKNSSVYLPIYKEVVNCEIFGDYSLFLFFKPNFYISSSQAIVDFLIGVYALLTIIPHLTYPTQLYPPVHPVTITITTVIGQSSVFLALGNLLLTSSERFLALHKPFLHR